MRILEIYNYYGHNRRSERTAAEFTLWLNDREITILQQNAPGILGEVLRRLQSVGIRGEALAPLKEPIPEAGCEAFAFIVSGIALALQRAAGHRVSFRAHVPEPHPGQFGCVYEHESSEAGLPAGELAIALIAKAEPGLALPEDWPLIAGELEPALRAYLVQAATLVLPRMTQAIIDACSRRDIPVFKLDRDPYEGIQGDFRICPNGMLQLGHARHKRLLDGSLCIDRGDLVHLRTDPAAVSTVIRKLGLPAPGGAAGQAVEGEATHIVVAGFTAVEALTAKCGNHLHVHPSTLKAAVTAARLLNVGLMVLTVVSPDIGRPLRDVGGVVSELDVAPVLDTFEGLSEAAMSEAAGRFVGWLFPDGVPARVPLVAVTGSNGKTTTTRMIAAMAAASGRQPGVASSVGVIIDGRSSGLKDMAGTYGHNRVFESDVVDFAVLETARGGVTHSGIAFDWCNVAVCGNVTRDHLGEYGIETWEDMVAAKRSVLARARDAVVINVDDPGCLSMLPFDRRLRLGIVSLSLGAQAARKLAGDERAVFAGLERLDGEDCIVLDGGGSRIPLMPVGNIPASFGGRLRYNIYNALQAILASLLAGVPVAAVRSAMSVFDASFDNNPGRMNVFEGLPFQVILNVMTSPEAVAGFCDFVRDLEVKGRRILLCAAFGNKSNEAIRQQTIQMLGAFDTWFLRDFTDLRGRQPGEVRGIVESTLIEAGVPSSEIHVLEVAENALEQALDLARAGDLLVIIPLTAEIEPIWRLLEQRAADLHSGPGLHGHPVDWR